MKVSAKRLLITIGVTLLAVFFIVLFGMALINKLANPGYPTASDGAILDNSCKTLYAGIVSGHITNEEFPDAQISLPSPDLDKEQRKEYAAKLTVEDAVIFAGMDTNEWYARINKCAVGMDGAIYSISSVSRIYDENITLSLSTTLGELYANRAPYLMNNETADKYLNSITKEYYAKVVSGDITRESITSEMVLDPSRLPEKSTAEEKRYEYARNATIGDVLDYFLITKYYGDDILSGLVASEEGGLFTREYAKERGIAINEKIKLTRNTTLGEIFAKKEPQLFKSGKILMMERS